MFIALLRKDWRVYRTVIVGTAVLAVAPYVFGLLLQWMFQPNRGVAARDYLEVVLLSASFGMFVAVLLAAVYGGAAFAAERRDRTAEFVAMLPVSRWHAAASKAVLSFACLLATWGLHYLAATASHHLAGAQAVVEPTIAHDAVEIVLPVMLLTFGLAWLLSSAIESPAIAAVAAIAAAVGLLLVTLFAARYAAYVWSMVEKETLSLDFNIYVRPASQAMSVGVGLLALLAGTAYYARRVRP